MAVRPEERGRGVKKVYQELSRNVASHPLRLSLTRTPKLKMHRFEGRGLIERSCKTKSNQPNRTKRCRQHFAHFLVFAKFKYAAQRGR